MDSLDKINSSIEKMVERLTSQIGHYLSDDKLSLSKLASNLEWFLTWRIKLEDLEDRMWCDGVIDLEVSKSGRHSINLKGRAYVGPESDVMTIYKCSLEGQIELSTKHDFIEYYNFKADVNGKLFEIVK
ncbi:hypothetical protein [Pleionea mediterranea]|uniref:Uncharacterized protein n=1 Tax=Pleionea mediterranea TaxID=523701 RepID=A0A316FAJ2_9GAMM|nr:hypothetical protein [Pleionea mediterranea]PWK45332.1 hypothetical protein C8D97_1145 [Pleionea mediterranea]